MSPEKIAQLEAEIEAEQHATPDNYKVEVERENWDAARLFSGLMSQWREQPVQTHKHFAMLRTGVELSALPVIAAARKIEIDDDILDKIKFLEAECIGHFADRAQRHLSAP